MSEGPLFVWLKLPENTTHFKTSFLQYRLIKNKPSTLCFPILILMNISLWVSSGISLRSDLHGVAADSWYMQSCKTQTQNKSPKEKHSAGFPRKKQIKELLEMFSFAGFLKWPFPSQRSSKGCGQDGTWGLRSRREGCFISFCWCLDDCALSRASRALWKTKQGYELLRWPLAHPGAGEGKDMRLHTGVDKDQVTTLPYSVSSDTSRLPPPIQCETQPFHFGGFTVCHS